jgi:hypothetical protein
MTKCSIVILSWSRPKNINSIIEKYNSYSIVEEIIVWNNNSLFLIHSNLSKVKIINTNKDLGLNSRFSAALLCKNRCIIVHDDDLMLSETNIKGLVDGFTSDYCRVYTYEGRKLVDNSYTNIPGPGRIERVSSPTEVDICLTRATCFDKNLAAEYLRLSDVAFYDTDICLNAEDILLSYISTSYFGKKPLVIPIPDIEGYVELPAELETKISTRLNFISERNKIINRCQIILPEPNYENKPNTIFGPGSYPNGYYEESTCYNSRYSKILVKDNNGIRYLSIDSDPSYKYATATILLNKPINVLNNLLFSLFFRTNSVPLEIQFSFLLNNKAYESKRVLLREISINYIEEYELTPKEIIADLIPEQTDFSDFILSEIKFIIHNDNKHCELCVVDLSYDNKREI